VSAVAAVALLIGHFNAAPECVVDYNGSPRVIGRVLTPDGIEHVRANPGLTPPQLLLEVGGDPTLMWTRASVRSCRFWAGWAGLLPVPLFAVGVAALAARRRFRFGAVPQRTLPSPRVPQTASASAPVFDAFLSYRHTEPDREHAGALLEALEARGLRVAIDFRDFAPNEHFLSEMERCIKESRFVLCVVTPRYVDSDHCTEEAIISKTLDLSDRRKRLVPLIFERVELPVWLHGLVGIDFTASASVDPVERLLALVTQKTRGARP
jgi:hypothetical protein